MLEQADFKQRLKELREKRGISRRVLSELCGLNPGLIRLYERGERQPTMHSLIAIADFFDVRINYLVGREGADNDKV